MQQYCFHTHAQVFAAVVTLLSPKLKHWQQKGKGNTMTQISFLSDEFLYHLNLSYILGTSLTPLSGFIHLEAL